jgi:hypothetical protein
MDDQERPESKLDEDLEIDEESAEDVSGGAVFHNKWAKPHVERF